MKTKNAMRWCLTGVGLVLALAVAGCSAPGGDGSNQAGEESDTAKAAAKSLGIDLAKCPTDVTKKLGSKVEVGGSYPISGPLAAIFAPGIAGITTGFETLNKSSGLGTSFDLLPKDDQLQPDKSRAAAQELIDKDKVDFMHYTLGTASVIAQLGLLGDQCVPLLPGNSGAPEANEPAKYPWAVMMAPSAELEVKIWVQDVQKSHPDGAKIALYSANSETGVGYVDAVKAAIQDTNLDLVTEQTIEAADQAPPSSQVTTMKASGANVLFVATVGAQCPSVMTEAANKGWKPDTYVTAICNPTGLFNLAGPAADGAKTTQFVKDPQSPQWANDPAVEQVRAAFGSKADEITSSTFGGWAGPEVFFAAAKAAAASDLGLSRLGMLHAMRHLDFQPDVFIPGIKVKLDGTEDIWAIETLDLQQYDASAQDFTSLGLVGLEGQLTK